MSRLQKPKKKSKPKQKKEPAKLFLASANGLAKFQFNERSVVFRTFHKLSLNDKNDRTLQPKTKITEEQKFLQSLDGITSTHFKPIAAYFNQRNKTQFWLAARAMDDKTICARLNLAYNAKDPNDEKKKKDGLNNW